MQQSVLEMAKDLVKAQIQAGQLTPDTMNQALQDIFANLTALQAREERVAAGVSSVTGRPSIHFINSLAKLGPAIPGNTGASSISTDFDQYARPRLKLTLPA